MSGNDASSLAVTITEPARARMLELRVAEPDADALAVWVEVGGPTNGSVSYNMYFQDLEAAEPGDTVELHADLAVVIPKASVDKLRGATIAMSGEQLVIRDANSPPPNDQISPTLGAADRPITDLTGEVAQRIVRVLDEQINPAIAAHGGRAELIAVEERVAYLRLSGGCQGCGIADITIKQGIEVAILDAVPDITEVVDVTDHASGAHPFYESPEH
jgi:Fe/S biogenesis protein NfuA